jgi:hypothetical protein
VRVRVGHRGRAGVPCLQVAISLGELEMGFIDAAAPALEAHREGLAVQLIAMPHQGSAFGGDFG